jgi:hypothetical protein
MATQVTNAIRITLSVPGSDAEADIDVQEGTTLEQVRSLLEAGNPEIKSIDFRLIYNDRAVRPEEAAQTTLRAGDRVGVARKVTNG